MLPITKLGWAPEPPPAGPYERETVTSPTLTGGSLAVVGAQLRTNTADHSEATALLIREGQIVALGDDEGIRAAADADGITVRDVAGATVTPGLFDSHSHPFLGSETLAWVDLAGKDTLDEIRAALATEAARLPAGAWVRGWNLEYEPFEETGIRGDLFDAAVDGHPLAAQFYDCHTYVANQAALEIAGVTGAREFDDASEIVVDPNGVPTGEVREITAIQLLTSAAPEPTHEEAVAASQQILGRFASVGLTGGAIMNGGAKSIQILTDLEARGELVQRMTLHQWHTANTDDAEMARIIASRDARGRLWQANGIKLISDGVVDTGTAWLHEPDTCGDGTASLWPDWDVFADIVRRYDEAGMLVTTHAVGDYAVSRVLDIYASLPPRARPARIIEHLEVLTDQDIEQLKGSGVLASMQPSHMQWRMADGSDNWTVRLGEGRSETGYRARSVLNAGVALALGSDWPVATYDPRVNMAWARGRREPGTPNAPVFDPQECLTGEEALLAYTLWPARARGHDDRGALAPGMVGDLTIWAEDPVTVDPDELIGVDIVATVVDGRVVFG